MNAKAVKILRKVAPKMGVTEDSAKKAFQHLSKPEQVKFLAKAKDKLYGKRIYQTAN